MSQAVIARHTTDHADSTLRSYVTGFLASIMLTLGAFGLAEAHIHHTSFAHGLLIFVLVVLAFIQFVIQLWFFLHLGSETKPRWRLLVFVFMVSVVSILVLGTLWIMHNLDYRMTPTTQQVDQYLNSQDGL